MRPSILLKKGLPSWYVLENFVKFSRTAILLPEKYSELSQTSNILIKSVKTI